MPAGWAVNDVLVLFVQSRAAEVPAVPSGWTAGPGATMATSARDSRIRTCYKVAVAGETAPTVVDVGDHLFVVIMAIRGSNGVLDASQSSADASLQTTATVTGTTTTVGDCFVVVATTHGEGFATAAFTSWTNASLANLTERYDLGTTQGIGGGLGIATGEKATAGATGTTTASGSAVGSHRQANVTMAFQPAASDSVGMIPI
jgi:hypothetical protein